MSSAGSTPESRHAMLVESEDLHDRVAAFARGAANAETFDALALEIAGFQARFSPGFARLLEDRAGELSSLDDIPAVPTEAFRLARVAVHPADLDAVAFRTSGTTSAARGTHFMRTTRSYEDLSARFGARALLSDGIRRTTVVALAPPPGPAPSSSLGYMMRHFMRVFDGRALCADPHLARFDPDASDRWLATSRGIDVEGLRRAARVAADRHDGLLVLGTSLALAVVLDELDGEVLALPQRTVVMQTGGFKGRRQSVDPSTLRAGVARAFRISESCVIGEYGMTELTSQLYEGCLPGGSLRSPPSVYCEPPWLRVVPVDPVSLTPASEGQAGLAKIIDLGNVDSAVAILAQDVVRRREGGIELLGRIAGAPPRGCSITLDDLVVGRGPGAP